MGKAIFMIVAFVALIATLKIIARIVSSERANLIYEKRRSQQISRALRKEREAYATAELWAAYDRRRRNSVRARDSSNAWELVKKNRLEMIYSPSGTIAWYDSKGKEVETSWYPMT